MVILVLVLAVLAQILIQEATLLLGLGLVEVIQQLKVQLDEEEVVLVLLQLVCELAQQEPQES
jgi:hypothetical protein